MAQQGNITQYNSPVDSIKPDESGAAALARAGREVGSIYREAGQDYKQGIDNLTGPIAKQIDEHDYMDEVSKGSAAGAALLNNKTSAWNQLASQPGAADDKTLQDKFLNDNLEPDLQKFQDGFTTEKGQKWALDQADRIRSHFYDKTSADMANLAGEARVQDAKISLNQFGSTVANDPTSFDISSQGFKSYVDELRKHFDGTPEASAKLDAFEHDGLNELAKVQVKAYADKGNFAAATHLLDSGIHKDNISPPEQSELRSYIANGKVVRALQAAQAREQQQYKDIQVNEQTTHGVFSDMAAGKMISATTAFSAKGLSPQQRTDFISTEKNNPGILMLPRQWLTSTDYGPGFTTTAEGMQRGEPVTPAGLTKGVRMYMTNPSQAITPAGAARLQEIQDKMKTSDGAYEVQMQNAALDNLKSQMMVGGKYATDTKGKDIFSGMQNSFYSLWDSEIRSGKTPSQLSDPESKDYIGNAFVSLKRPPAQALADVVNAKPAAQQKVELPAADKRIVGQTYPTARGPMVWMEGGWAAPKKKE